MWNLPRGRRGRGLPLLLRLCLRMSLLLRLLLRLCLLLLLLLCLLPRLCLLPWLARLRAGHQPNVHVRDARRLQHPQRVQQLGRPAVLLPHDGHRRLAPLVATVQRQPGRTLQLGGAVAKARILGQGQGAVPQHRGKGPAAQHRSLRRRAGWQPATKWRACG